MHPPHRNAAQQRADDIQVFLTELARLEAQGIVRLSDAQRQAVTTHHDGVLAGLTADFDIDCSTSARQLSLGMRVVSFLAALALGAFVFFLYYQFWGLFGETSQVVILAGVALGSLGLVAWIQGVDPSGYFTKLAALVAFTCFVLNVILLGEIFNVTPTNHAILPWAALAFLLAYTCDLRLMLAVGICCVIAYVSARVGEHSGVYWLSLGKRPESYFPVAALLFTVPRIIPHQRFAGFDALYRVFGLLCVLLPMLVLGHWGSSSYLLLPPSRIEGLYQLGGFAVSALAIWLGARRGWAGMVNTGIVFFIIFLFTKFFDWWGDLPKWLFFLAMALSAIAVLVFLKGLRARSLRA